MLGSVFLITHSSDQSSSCLGSSLLTKLALSRGLEVELGRPVRDFAGYFRQLVSKIFFHNSSYQTSTSVTKALTDAQCHVVMADRNAEGMKNVLEDMSSSYADLSTYMVQCDITDPTQVQDLIDQADEFALSQSQNDQGSSFATLLVNCAGITKDNWISRMEMKEWDDVIDVNLKGTYLTCRYFFDQERADRFFPKGTDRNWSSGAIVNVGSIVSERGNLGQVNYAASKGGVLGLTRALAKEVAARNVNVNAIVPGFIHSPMSHAVPDHVKERLKLQIPQRRFGNPQEVADLVCFLLSPRSSYITGECISISGMIAL
jgi:NAD(P)-dependent dehydrogenase (short-subunit alcohol dehydrogenase family)